MSTAQELFAAISAGDLDRVHALLGDEPDLASARNESGISAVLWAMYHGQRPIAERLVAAGLELELPEAAAVGDLSRVRALLSEDPSLVQRPSPDGFSPLGLASFFGNLEVLVLLLEHRADPNAPSRNPMQVTPLHSAVAHRESEVSHRMAEALLGAGANPNLAQQGGWTPLHQAAAHGREPLVELLLAHGADPRAKSTDGQTPEQKAAEGGHLNVAKRLQELIPAVPD